MTNESVIINRYNKFRNIAKQKKMNFANDRQILEY